MGLPRVRRIAALSVFVGSRTAGIVGKWWIRSRETTNFTYPLEARNEKHLCHFIANELAVDVRRVESLVRELKEDRSLREHIRSATRASLDRAVADSEASYAKRLGWYAIVRIRRPRLVVETGVDKGLGSVVLAAALLRNAEEGFPGEYLGTDINPAAGYLLQGPYGSVGKILYGDSIASLRTIQQPIDLFINDSDHSADYEAREYAEVAAKLSPHAIVVGDNAHATDKLLEFAERTERRFAFFREQPHEHWYPGAGIGLAMSSTE